MASLLQLTVRSVTDCIEISIQSTETIAKVCFTVLSFLYGGRLGPYVASICYL